MGSSTQARAIAVRRERGFRHDDWAILAALYKGWGRLAVTEPVTYSKETALRSRAPTSWKGTLGVTLDPWLYDLGVPPMRFTGDVLDRMAALETDEGLAAVEAAKMLGEVSVLRDALGGRTTYGEHLKLTVRRGARLYLGEKGVAWTAEDTRGGILLSKVHGEARRATDLQILRRVELAWRAQVKQDIHSIINQRRQADADIATREELRKQKRERHDAALSALITHIRTHSPSEFVEDFIRRLRR